MAQTIHKHMTDEEYQEALDAGYPIDEDDLLPSYKKKLMAARNNPANRMPSGQKPAAGREANPLLESKDLNDDRASRTFGGISKAFGGKKQGPAPEDEANEGLSSMFSGVKNFIKKLGDSEMPPAPKKKKKMMDEE